MIITHHSDTASGNKSAGIFICLILLVITFSVYWQIHTFDFIRFDDDQYVYGNPHVKTGVTMNNVIWAFTAFHSCNWHPLTWISHMIDCQFFGLNPGPHHVVNLAFHIINTLLLFLVFKKMTGGLWQSAFVAALFALHPLHVESVAWIAERKDVLSAFFWMLTIFVYEKYARRPTVVRYFFVFLFFALGLMSKPMVVTLPFVLLLMDLWPLKRIRINHPPDGKSTHQINIMYRLILEKIPLFFLSAISSVITFYAQKSGQSVANLNLIPIHTRIANSLVSYATYIESMIWPTKLGVLYPYVFQQPVWKIMGACLIVIFISLLSVTTIRKIPYFFVGWLWYLGTLIPVIGLVQVGRQAMADRYTYIPFIGLFIIFAWGMSDFYGKIQKSRIAFASSAMIIVTVLTIVTWKQIGYWKNSILLFEHTLAVTSDNYLIHNNLGLVLEPTGPNPGSHQSLFGSHPDNAELSGASLQSGYYPRKTGRS